MTSRRRFLIGCLALGVLPLPLRAASGPAIHVFKDPDCGCCSGWMEILAREGFAVTSESAAGEALARIKAQAGIAEEFASCHTAFVGGYAIEGHVPAADIRRLLAERPEAAGLAVPGMPYGAPGMGPEEERDAYDVLLIRRDGTAEVFASYAAT